MIYDNDTLMRLQNKVKEVLSEFRFNHTLGVTKMATFLGDILMKDSVSELVAAALLHDIVKELNHDVHLELLRDGGITLSESDINILPALHSFAAAPFIKNNYPDFATENILSAVSNHTLGSPNMSVFDEIIFISDYSEEGRRHDTCKEVRRFLLNNISVDKSYEENVVILHQASIKAIDATIKALTESGKTVSNKSIETKQYLKKEISKYEC